MRCTKNYIINIFISVLFSSCSLLGIHKTLQNPKHASKYPKFSESTKLLGNENTKYRKCFDATYYNLSVTVDDQNKYLKGKVDMYATAVSDFDTLQIDLYANMKVNKLSSEGKDLPYKRKYGAIFVALKEKAGEKFKITIDYEGKPVEARKPPWDGGFVWKKDQEKNPWIGVACETEGASLWWPCKDVNNDEPDSASINITVPKKLTAVSNGQFRGKEENGDLATYKWFVSYPINLYDVTLYVGNFVLLADTYTSPVSGKIIPFNHYVLAPDYEKAKEHFQQAKPVIAFYEKTYGEFPWPRDGYRLVEAPYEGMEHQTAIAYGNGFKSSFLGLPFDYIIVHESAHEWWGNAVTASDFADVWLQEGFATYSEALYVESTQGKNMYINYMLFYRLFIQDKWPVVGPRDVRYFYYKNSDCYQKGAWVLHTLRSLINQDSVFFDILKTFQARFRYKTVTSQDFIDIINEKTNDDYGWFFKQYLNKREVPMLEYYWDGDKFYYRWDCVDADFKMPVDIILDNLIKVTITPKKSDKLVQVMPISKETYKEISFDNYTKLFGVKENKKLKKMPVIVPE